MDQYFSNCCQLNFSKRAFNSPKNVLHFRSPPKKINDQKKSQKKSLKRVSSNHVLTFKKNTSINSPSQQKKKLRIALAPSSTDYCGHFFYQNHSTKNQFQNKKQKVVSAQISQIKFAKSLEKQIKPNFLNEEPAKLSKNDNFKTNKKVIKVQRNDYKSSLPVQNNIYTTIIPYRQSMPIPTYNNNGNLQLNRSQKKVPKTTFQYNNLPQNNFNQFLKTIKNQHRTEKTNIKNNSKTEYQEANTTFSRQSLYRQSQNFNKIYGDVELERQIKDDLLKSLDFDKIEYHTESKSNLVSKSTKAASSQDSTIVPFESKITKNASSSDKFSFQKKIKTQNHFRNHQFSHKAHQFDVKCFKRQKFNSIVSLESQNDDSNQGKKSIIIEKHPKEVVISNPLKTLF